jgi:hypothetical protein
MVPVLVAFLVVGREFEVEPETEVDIGCYREAVVYCLDLVAGKRWKLRMEVEILCCWCFRVKLWGGVVINHAFSLLIKLIFSQPVKKFTSFVQKVHYSLILSMFRAVW